MGNNTSSEGRVSRPFGRSMGALGLSKNELEELCKPSGYVAVIVLLLHLPLEIFVHVTLASFIDNRFRRDRHQVIVLFNMTRHYVPVPSCRRSQFLPILQD